jgi:hypothetical protein
MLQTLKTRKSCANNRISILWPGTGEVGTTLGKESGNAEITIVIKYYNRKTARVHVLM